MKTNPLSLSSAAAVALAGAFAAVALTGCYTPSGQPDNTATGALEGGAFGAATGAIIGSASHSAGLGALIGAGAGATLGALIGHSADQAQEARLQQEYPATYVHAQQGAPLSVADIKALNKSGVNDDTIIAQITVSHTIYQLSADDVIDLHNSGVSQRVIDFMITTSSAVAAAPLAANVGVPPPVPVVEPVTVAPGPGYVWVNGEWVWNNGWYWTAGHWLWPPYPGAIWVGGYWGRGPRGWVRYGGHWRR